MNRLDFIKYLSLGAFTLPSMKIQALKNTLSNFQASEKMPILFVGHGSPMNAILDNSFNKKWKELGNELPQPKAILVISAHWITNGVTKVTAMSTPRTIHDFGGFPEELFKQHYPASGSPDFAKQTIDLIQQTAVQADFEWGLDHGTWSVLKPMFPKAEVPVYQISLDYSSPASFHYELGKELKALREKGVLIVGSGNIVHNLSELDSEVEPYDWAQEFDSKIKDYIDQRDFRSVVNFQNLGSLSDQAHPSYDHFLPLLHILGATEEKDQITYFNDSFDMGSISMRSLLIN